MHLEFKIHTTKIHYSGARVTEQYFMVQKNYTTLIAAVSVAFRNVIYVSENYGRYFPKNSSGRAGTNFFLQKIFFAERNLFDDNFNLFFFFLMQKKVSFYSCLVTPYYLFKILK